MAFSLDGFTNETVIGEGLAAPLALGFLPDNRMLLLEKGGEILIVDPESGETAPYLDISGIVNSGNERGLLEIAIAADLDPDPASGRNEIFLFYTRSADTDRAVIARFEHVEGSGGLSSRADAASETILWTDTDDFVSCCHYGGGLDSGPDGKIWLTSSDKLNTSDGGEGGNRVDGDNWPVDVEHTSGKIIRINRDGTIPDGTDGWAANPYVDGIVDSPYPTAAEEETFGGALTPDPSIWAYGLRNPFRADWDLERGLLYIGEVGGNQNRANGTQSTDDVHVASLDQAGVFYGWNFYEGRDHFEPAGSVTNFDPADFPQPDGDVGDPATRRAASGERRLLFRPDLRHPALVADRRLRLPRRPVPRRVRRRLLLRELRGELHPLPRPRRERHGGRGRPRLQAERGRRRARGQPDRGRVPRGGARRRALLRQLRRERRAGAADRLRRRPRAGGGVLRGHRRPGRPGRRRGRRAPARRDLRRHRQRLRHGLRRPDLRAHLRGRQRGGNGGARRDRRDLGAARLCCRGQLRRRAVGVGRDQDDVLAADRHRGGRPERRADLRDRVLDPRLRGRGRRVHLHGDGGRRGRGRPGGGARLHGRLRRRLRPRHGKSGP